MSKKTKSSQKQGNRIHADLRAVVKAEHKLSRSRRRFAANRYLREVLRIYRKWERRGVEKQYGRELARTAGITSRSHAHPIKLIIDATSSDCDPKKKSRWGRALQFIALRKIPSKGLDDAFRKNGGIAGCARQSAITHPKRRHSSRYDWS